MTNNFISNETPIVGKLSIISMKGCEGITAKIDEYLRAFRGYEDTETYVTHVTCPRFGTGEGKCVMTCISYATCSITVLPIKCTELKII